MITITLVSRKPELPRYSAGKPTRKNRFCFLKHSIKKFDFHFAGEVTSKPCQGEREYQEGFQ